MKLSIKRVNIHHVRNAHNSVQAKKTHIIVF